MPSITMLCIVCGPRDVCVCVRAEICAIERNLRESQSATTSSAYTAHWVPANRRERAKGRNEWMKEEEKKPSESVCLFYAHDRRWANKTKWSNDNCIISIRLTWRQHEGSVYYVPINSSAFPFSFAGVSPRLYLHFVWWKFPFGWWATCGAVGCVCARSRRSARTSFCRLITIYLSFESRRSAFTLSAWLPDWKNAFNNQSLSSALANTPHHHLPPSAATSQKVRYSHNEISCRRVDESHWIDRFCIAAISGGPNGSTCLISRFPFFRSVLVCLFVLYDRCDTAVERWIQCASYPVYCFRQCVNAFFSHWKGRKSLRKTINTCVDTKRLILIIWDAFSLTPGDRYPNHSDFVPKTFQSNKQWNPFKLSRSRMRRHVCKYWNDATDATDATDANDSVL